MPTWPIPARPRRELATPTPLPSFPSRERPRAAHVDREARLNMRYFPSLPPHPARRIQMSSLPAISNEAGAFAKLQQHFPGLPRRKLWEVLDSWGAGDGATPMRPWDVRVEHAVDHLLEEGELALFDSGPDAPPATGRA